MGHGGRLYLDAAHAEGAVDEVDAPSAQQQHVTRAVSFPGHPVALFLQLPHVFTVQAHRLAPREAQLVHRPLIHSVYLRACARTSFSSVGRMASLGGQSRSCLAQA